VFIRIHRYKHVFIGVNTLGGLKVVKTTRKYLTVHEDTYIRLLRRKKYPEESLNKVVNRILDGDTSERD
jgi:hypothetical protein